MLIDTTTTTNTTSTTTSTTITSTATTTTITSSTTTITYTLPSTCPVSIFGNQTLASFTNLPGNIYSNYTFTFTAISSPRTTLEFAVSSNHNSGWFLDNVSVRGLGGSNNTELVTNGDFSGNLTGWTLLCSMDCSVSSTQGQSLVMLTGCPLGSMAPCYYAECKSTYVYLMQSLATTIGTIYNLSFSICPASPSSDILFVFIA
ncbi:unnamed protein product [Adineta steineri]|uniref:Uncharacterized protein n=1 Tax=Adineta steineri TaxID=433720 RepID=A0A820ELQ2_9BILA|nr:unnamed protein product [Adineta steineri]